MKRDDYISLALMALAVIALLYASWSFVERIYALEARHAQEETE